MIEDLKNVVIGGLSLTCTALFLLLMALSMAIEEPIPQLRYAYAQQQGQVVGEPAIAEFNGTMAKQLALIQLFQSNFTGATFYENGTLVLSFTYPQSGITPTFNFTISGIHPFTPDQGFRFDNQSLYAPDGRQIVAVPD